MASDDDVHRPEVHGLVQDAGYRAARVDAARIDWRQPSAKLPSPHSATGLESPWVAAAGLQVQPLGGDRLGDALRLVHVAMTRADRQRPQARPPRSKASALEPLRAVVAISQ